MTRHSSTIERLMREVLALSLLLPLVLSVGTALAAGTGGVDVSPYPGVRDGKQITAFHVKVPSRGKDPVRYALRNTTAKPATARLFAARATRTDDTYTIGPAGSSPYVVFPDRSVTLKPNETRIETFSVQPGPNGRPKGKAYAALVVEVKNGAVIQQAATVIYLEPGRVVPLPVLIVGLAVALLVVVGAGLLITRRRRQSGSMKSPSATR